MSWSSLIGAYLESLRTRGYSPSTMRSRRMWLGRLAEWATRCGLLSPAQVTSADVAAYQRHLLWEPGVQGRLLAPNTIYHALAHLCALFAWAADAGHLVADPAERLVLPRPPQPLPTLLTQAEVLRLLNAPNLKRLSGLRDRAVLETLYCTAVRRTECVSLDLQDYDRSRSELRIRGKGGTERLVPTGKALDRMLSHYLAEARPRLAAPAENALFVSRYGSRLSAQMAHVIVRQNAVSAGLTMRVSCHLLRHACASHLMHNGADLRQIQAGLAGHVRLSTTERYLHLLPDELRRELERTHPRARRRKGAD